MALAVDEPEQDIGAAAEDLIAAGETDPPATAGASAGPWRIRSEELGKHYGFRRFHVLLLVVAGITTLTPAATIGTGPYVQSRVLKEYESFGVSTASISLVTSSVMLGSTLGVLVCGELGDRFGRRKSIATFIVVVGLISLLHFFVPTGKWGFPVLVLLRVLLGFAYGGFIVLPSVYMSEFFADRWRGAAIINLSAFWNLGSLYSVQFIALHPGQAWRASLALAPLAPCVAGLVALVAVPESPRWLLVAGKADAANKALERIFASKPVLSDAVVGRTPEIVAPSASAQGNNSALQDLRLLFGPALRRNTSLASSIYLLVAGTNNSAWIYGPSLLQKVTGHSVNDNMQVFALSEIMGIIGALTGMALVDGWGRKPLMVAACSLKVCTFALLPRQVMQGCVDALWAVQGFVDAVLWAGMQVFMVEVFPTDLRGVGVGFAALGGRLSSVLFPLLAGQVLSLGASALCAYFICFYLVVMVLLYFLEETARTAMRDSCPGKSVDAESPKDA